MVGNNTSLGSLSKQSMATDRHKIWADNSIGMLEPFLAVIVAVAGAVVVSYYQQLGIEQEMTISIIRGIIQLSIIGFVLEFIFKQPNVVWIFIAYIFMVTVAGNTAGRRAKHVPRGAYVAGGSILVGTSFTLTLLVALNLFPFTPRFIIPIAGMMVGISNYLKPEIM
jgi:putative ABC transport system permease protein